MIVQKKINCIFFLFLLDNLTVPLIKTNNLPLTWTEGPGPVSIEAVIAVAIVPVLVVRLHGLCGSVVDGLQGE